MNSRDDTALVAGEFALAAMVRAAYYILAFMTGLYAVLETVAFWSPSLNTAATLAPLLYLFVMGLTLAVIQSAGSRLSSGKGLSGIRGLLLVIALLLGIVVVVFLVFGGPFDPISELAVRLAVLIAQIGLILVSLGAAQRMKARVLAACCIPLFLGTIVTQGAATLLWCTRFIENLAHSWHRVTVYGPSSSEVERIVGWVRFERFFAVAQIPLSAVCGLALAVTLVLIARVRVRGSDARSVSG